MNFIPRFQGNALKDDKGWYWELFISEFGGGNIEESFSTTERFNTKEDCLKELHNVIQGAIDSLAKNFPELNIESGAMIDLKTNQKLTKNQKVN